MSLCKSLTGLPGIRNTEWCSILSSLADVLHFRPHFPLRLGEVVPVSLKQGFPTWGTCTLRGTFAYLKGTFKVSNRREKYIYIPFLSKYLYCTYISELYIKKSLYAYCQIHLWIIMKKYFVMRNISGTCSSVEILKGCMIICWNAEGIHAHLPEC